VHESRLVVVQGNHDRPRRALPHCISHQLLGDLLGLELLEELTLTIDGDRYLVQHGDRFDQTLNMTTLGYLAEGFYRQTQRWHQPTSRWLKRQSKSLLGIELAVRRKALACAQARGFAGIILGHTHYASNEQNDAGIRYLNTGSWVDDACTYLDITEDRVMMKEWQGETTLVEPVTYRSEELEPIFAY
jgi:UDP-2,3-diacylglucosamine pyrophosphatase LpxH